MASTIWFPADASPTLTKGPEPGNSPFEKSPAKLAPTVTMSSNRSSIQVFASTALGNGGTFVSPDVMRFAIFVGSWPRKTSLDVAQFSNFSR